jgi:hypothetical protein
MPTVPADVCLVYLAWRPLGIEPVRAFVDSYRRYEPGVPHRLVVALKGYDEDSLPPLRAELAGVEHEEALVDPSLLDLGTYRVLAEACDAEHACFLNTESRALADGWLARLRGAAAAPDVGIAGASGSLESMLSDAPRWLKAARALQFAAFPNPHVRTNAFLARRELLLELDWPLVRRKGPAHRLESGRRSLTRQILDRGLRPVVVGRDGVVFDPPEWAASRTFRLDDQGNLLVADKRTEQYARADTETRGALRRAAWGAAAG